MSLTSMTLVTAFMISFLGATIYRSHIMSALLCLEGMMLSLFILSSTTTLNLNYTSSFPVPVILLVFAACEAAVGLALLVMISNTYGLDYVQNLNLLQC